MDHQNPTSYSSCPAPNSILLYTKVGVHIVFFMCSHKRKFQVLPKIKDIIYLRNVLISGSIISSRLQVLFFLYTTTSYDGLCLSRSSDTSSIPGIMTHMAKLLSILLAQKCLTGVFFHSSHTSKNCITHPSPNQN